MKSSSRPASAAVPPDRSVSPARPEGSLSLYRPRTVRRLRLLAPPRSRRPTAMASVPRLVRSSISFRFIFQVYFSGLRQWLALAINAERFEDAERVEVVPPVNDLTILDGDD